jgi:hypothetical protein
MLAQLDFLDRKAEDMLLSHPKSWLLKLSSFQVSQVA